MKEKEIAIWAQWEGRFSFSLRITDRDFILFYFIFLFFLIHEQLHFFSRL